MKRHLHSVNLSKIDRMALLTFRNAVRLHLDSVKLFVEKSYATAYFLSVIALEELGKVFFLSDFLYDSRINGRLNAFDDPELKRMFGENVEEGYFRKHLFNHKYKQRKFVREFDSDFRPANKYMEALRDGLIETKKQDALSVGFKGKKTPAFMKGQISIPETMPPRLAANQIDLVHFSILELTLNVSTESVDFEQFQSRAEAHQHLFDYIEVFYNHKRLHSSLGYHTPWETLQEINNKKAA